jgi:hypothetical protein
VEGWSTAHGLEGLTIRVRSKDLESGAGNPAPDYTESPVLVGECVLGSGAVLEAGRFVGYPGGFGGTAEIVLLDSLAGETVVRRLAFDLAVTAIREADVQRFTLIGAGDEVDLGRGYATSIGAGGARVTADWRYREGELPFDFYAGRGRLRDDLFQIHDADGRRVGWTGSDLGGGSETMGFEILDPPKDPLRFPVQVALVVPTRWETRTHRVVLENLALPARPTRSP